MDFDEFKKKFPKCPKCEGNIKVLVSACLTYWIIDGKSEQDAETTAESMVSPDAFSAECMDCDKWHWEDT